MPHSPSLTITLDIKGDLCVQTPAGTLVRVEPELCHTQLYQMLLAQEGQRRSLQGVGTDASPLQWTLDEQVRKFRIATMIREGKEANPGRGTVQVRHPAPPVRRFDKSGREIRKVTLAEVKAALGRANMVEALAAINRGEPV